MMPRRKILIGDSSLEITQSILNHPDAALYEIILVSDGPSCEEKMTSIQPELLIVDLKLPKIHPSKLLQLAKETYKIPAIVLSWQPMIQNYHWALDFGITYFLSKPFSTDQLFQLIKEALQGTLKPAPFEEQKNSSISSPVEFSLDLSRNYAKFWGTRGSSAVSGSQFNRYGGNTPCLEVFYENSLVIIDAGTGLRPLGEKLKKSPIREFHIFISHTHWDHLAGLHFFTPLYNPEAVVHIWAPAGFKTAIQDLIFQMFSYPFFPVRMDDIAAKLLFHELKDGDLHQIGHISIATAHAYHPGPTLCFKISAGKSSFGYVTDNEVLMGYHGDPRAIIRSHDLLKPHIPMLEFFEGCPLMIHEAQYTPEEYRKKVGWGHSSVTNAAALLAHLHPKDWIVTHHDPSHNDDAIMKKLFIHYETIDLLNLRCRTRMAFDGFTIPLH